MIRLSNGKDVEAIIQVWLEASQASHDSIPCEHWLSLVNEMRELRIPYSETYVYELNGRVVGFVSLVDDDLMALYVAPDSQGKGIGGKLIAFAKSKRNSLQLDVYCKNTRAIAFYEHAGFTVAHEKIDAAVNEPQKVMQWSQG